MRNCDVTVMSDVLDMGGRFVSYSSTNRWISILDMERTFCTRSHFFGRRQLSIFIRYLFTIVGFWIFTYSWKKKEIAPESSPPRAFCPLVAPLPVPQR